MSTTLHTPPAAPVPEGLPTFSRSKRRKTHLRAPRARSPSPPPADGAVHLPRRPHHRFGIPVTASPATPSTAAAPAPEAEALAVVDRFTHQTGAVSDVDKHMMAYIEAQMLARRGAEAAAAAPEPVPVQRSSYWAPTRPEARGATLGKLHEVDLGEEAKQRNIARTQAALTTPAGDEHEHGHGHHHARRRRNSQDVERDRLVEEVLKETRLDLYNESAGSGVSGDEDEGAADDKIAEKFRKEFIDAILSKRRRRGADPKVKGGKKEDKKRPKGPKLGGSRMARAQMRELQMGAAAGTRK